MPGVEICDNVIIGAESVVTKSIPTNSVVVGTPAKIIGSFDNFKETMLQNYTSERDIYFTKPYRERVEEVVDKKMKSFLKNER